MTTFFALYSFLGSLFGFVGQIFDPKIAGHNNK